MEECPAIRANPMLIDVVAVHPARLGLPLPQLSIDDRLPAFGFANAGMMRYCELVDIHVKRLL